MSRKDPNRSMAYKDNNTNGLNYSLGNKENNPKNPMNIPSLKSRINYQNFLKQGVQDSSRIQESVVRGILRKNPKRQIYNKRTKAVTMKIRVASIRDRWLMNIREFDYEVYLSSAFMLVCAKDCVDMVKKTKMTRLVSQDAQNLLHFIENNRSLEELRAIKRLKEKNMSKFMLENFDFFIQRKDRLLDLMSRIIAPVQVRPTGLYIKLRKKDDFTYLHLNDICVRLEEKPKDVSRFKAINKGWLNWSESTEVADSPCRILIDAYLKEKDVQYAIYCKSKVEAKRLRDYMVVNFNRMEEMHDTIDFAVLRQRIKSAEWFYKRLVYYCRVKLGADDLFIDDRRDLDEEEIGKLEKDLPIFLNKGLLALGSLSVYNISGDEFKRGIGVWGKEDLSIIEIGHREQHFKELPTFTFDKVICTLDKVNVPFSTFLDIAVIKNRMVIIKKNTIGFSFKRRMNNIAYFELAQSYKKKSFLHLEDIFSKVEKDDSITIRLTLRIGDKRYEDFEFSLYAYVSTFYVKTVSYVDFFGKDFVLVMKSLKLHNSTRYDDFTQVFEQQNIFIDDFNSSRMVFPNFSPRMLLKFEKAFLEQGDFTDEIDIDMDVQDGYVSAFYKELFFKMRYDMIEQNFVKEKINFDLWWTFVKKLKIPKNMARSLSFHYNIDLPRSIENLSIEISSDDRRGFSDLMFAATLGIKNEVRGVFWENLADRHSKYKVRSKLDKYAPLLVEELYVMLNRPNKYGVKCLFRNHQRIVTHFMSLLEKMTLGHQNTLSMVAQEVRNVILMLHEFFSKDHFVVAARAILLLSSLMHECPDDQEQQVDYFLRKAQREASFLKILMKEHQSSVLKKIFDLGLTVEGLFASHLMHTFSNLFQIELVLRVRDLYFLFKFYSMNNRHKDFDFFIYFKCCLLMAVIQKHRKMLIEIDTADEFINALEIACKSETEFKEILLAAYRLMDRIMQGQSSNATINNLKKDKMIGAKRAKQMGLKYLKKNFRFLNQFLKSWNLQEVTQVIDRKSFLPLLEHTQEFFREKKYKPVETQESQRFINSIRDLTSSRASLPDIIDTSSPEALVPLSSLKPQTFNQTVSENTVVLFLHNILNKETSKFHLYFLVEGKVVFTSIYEQLKGFEPKLFKYNPPGDLEHIEMQIREEKGGESPDYRTLSVDNYSGKIELRRYRVGVIEKEIVPLRCTSEGIFYGNMDQCDLELSILLSYKTKISIKEFQEEISPVEHFLQPDNYWRYNKRWLLPNFVEQNSLLMAKDFNRFSQEFFSGGKKKQDKKQVGKQKGLASILKKSERSNLDKSCLLPFSKYLELDYEMVPLCRALINGIFYARFSTTDKMNLLWDSLNFFENLQKKFQFDDGCLESDTIRYFIKVLVSRSWPSIPENTVDNLVDLKFYGKVPTISYAIFQCDGHILDLTSFFVSLLNHVHLATGRKELNFANMRLFDSIKRHIFETYKVFNDIEKGLLHLSVLTNRGKQNLVIEFEDRKGRFDLEKALENQDKRILIENQKSRITRQRYEETTPQFGIFSHISTLDSIKTVTRKYRVNSFLLLNGEYFEAVTMHSGSDVMELYEDFPEWDRETVEAGVDDGDYLCFLLVKPWELLVCNERLLVFL